MHLADDPFETIQYRREGGATAYATDEAPYSREFMSGRSFRDVYRIDLSTGKRDKVLTKSLFGATLSPSGKYAPYQQGGSWWSRDLTTGAKANLTAGIKSGFLNMEDDHPRVPERRAYGVAGLHVRRDRCDRVRPVRSLEGESRWLESDATDTRSRGLDGVSLRE